MEQQQQQQPEKLSYYQRNREKSLARAKAYRDSHRDEYNRKYKLWYRENKDELYARRRERIMNSRPKRVPKPKIKKEDIQQIIPITVESEPISNVEIINREIIVTFD